MLFFLNLDGTVTRSDTDHVYQGQNKVANVELFTLISPAQAAIQVAFTLPNGLTSAYMPMSYVGAYSVDESNQKQVHRWKLAVPYNVTEVEGQVGVSFNVLLNDGTSGQTQETINQTTYTASFIVEYSALPIPPTTATEDELGQLLDLLDKYYAQNASLAAKQPFVVGTVNTNTLGANQQASVAVEQSTTPDSNGNYPTNFTFSIPQGPKGETGDKGDKGETGLPALMYSKNVTTGPYSSFVTDLDGYNRTPQINDSCVYVSTNNDYLINGTIEQIYSDKQEAVVHILAKLHIEGRQGPRGDKGDKGETGPQGPQGETGPQGPQGIGIKSITSGTPTVVNDKTNTPITITLTDNTTVALVVSAENGKDGTSATVDIVQATGQSESAVMSQKAVTDELNKKATKTYVDAQDDKKLDKAGGTITDNLAVNGGVTIGGNLTVNGTTTTVDSTTLQVKDKLIEVAHGNTAALTTPAGLVAPKYDGTNSGALVFNGDGIASVGDVVLDASGNIDVTQSNLQPLATRTGLVGGNLVQYDSSAQTLKDSGKKISDLATTSQVNAKYTKPSGGIPKTDLASDVQTSLGKADSALQSAPVTSVNGKTGDVTLGAGDVGALPSSTKFVSSVNGQSGAVTGIATKDELNAKQNALTETQLAAVNSGITEAKRTKYDGYEEIINQKANSADLAAVATSGSYNNLSNIPVINQDLTNVMPVGGTYYRHIGASSDTFRNNTIYLYDGTKYISLRDIPTLQSSVAGLQQQVNNLQGQISGDKPASVSVILASSDWVADSTISPFTVKATKTLSSETGGAIVMGQFDEISLAYFTTEAAKARSAGMCIGAVPQASGSEITFYAVTAPTEQIQAIVIITPTRIND